MWRLWRFTVFEVIEAFELGIVHAHLVRSLHEVVSQIAVTRRNMVGIIDGIFAGLIFTPAYTGKLGQSSLILKTLDVANLGNNACSIDWPDTFNQGQCIRNDFHVFLDGFIKQFQLVFQSSNGYKRNGQDLIDRVVNSLSQLV